MCCQHVLWANMEFWAKCQEEELKRRELQAKGRINKL